MAGTGAQVGHGGSYFEELPVGEWWTSPGRTITEADLVTFAGFSGDYHPLHTDEEFAKKTQFGRRILHGAAIIGIATGLESRIGLKDGTALAFLGMTWDMQGPVFAGDTIHVRERVAEKRESRSKPGRGLVVFDVEIINQRGEVVQSGQWKILMLRKPAGA